MLHALLLSILQELENHVEILLVDPVAAIPQIVDLVEIAFGEGDTFGGTVDHEAVPPDRKGDAQPLFQLFQVLVQHTGKGGGLDEGMRDFLHIKRVGGIDSCVDYYKHHLFSLFNEDKEEFQLDPDLKNFTSSENLVIEGNKLKDFYKNKFQINIDVHKRSLKGENPDWEKEAERIKLQNGFDLDTHEELRRNIKSGKISIKNSRLPDTTIIEDVKPDNVISYADILDNFFPSHHVPRVALLQYLAPCQDVRRSSGSLLLQSLATKKIHVLLL